MPFNLNLRHNVFTWQLLHITQIANWSFDQKKPTKQTNFYYYIYQTLEMHVNCNPT